MALCRKLADAIRAERSGRLVTFACNRIFEDRCSQYMDVVSCNTYPGWIAEPSETDPVATIKPNQIKILRHFRKLCGRDKPILFSEIGCCAIYGRHDEAGAQWTEEFQAEYLSETIAALAASPEIAGFTLWQLNDAKSFHRTGSIIRVKPLSQNLAGVYDQYRRPKLAARITAEKFSRI